MPPKTTDISDSCEFHFTAQSQTKKKKKKKKKKRES
jgi:hypothetical protein